MLHGPLVPHPVMLHGAQSVMITEVAGMDINPATDGIVNGGVTIAGAYSAVLHVAARGAVFQVYFDAKKLKYKVLSDPQAGEITPKYTRACQ